MTKPTIIPVEPFDPEHLVDLARAAMDAGIEWEFDWLTPQQSDELVPMLRQAGILP